MFKPETRDFIQFDIPDWVYRKLPPFAQECIPENTFNGVVERETEKAYKILWNYGQPCVWIAKSQVSNVKRQTAKDFHGEMRTILEESMPDVSKEKLDEAFGEMGTF